jgi:hypothetical protein
MRKHGIHLSNKAYYFVKPAIPWRLRIAFRRLRARRLRKKFYECWPINEAAARKPADWPGWPNGKSFAFVLTHDVEGALGLVRSRQLAEFEKGIGFRSSFNLVPEGEEHPSPDLRSFLRGNGFEVGVHDLHHDGSLYRSKKNFGRQAAKINHYLSSWHAEGFRAGFMFHNLEWQHQLNMLYDSSTFDADPFEPQPDGMNTIFPFWVQREGVKGYVELPYTLAQDSTLFLVLGEKDTTLWKKKLDWIARNGGMALMNTHPDYMCFSGRPRFMEYPVGLYEQFLKYVVGRYRDSCWFALPAEIARFAHQVKPLLPPAPQ